MQVNEEALNMNWGGRKAARHRETCSRKAPKKRSGNGEQKKEEGTGGIERKEM